MRAFVAGATGYVGGAVVEHLCSGGHETIAHVRPDSSSLDAHRARFEELGASVDTTAWEDDAMAETIAALEPDVVFCCIGTTKKRMNQADDPDSHTYEAVDYGLTALLVRASLTADPRPTFVYVSAAGTSESSLGSYMQARYKAEQYIQHSELPYIIARPAFITGDDRDESRPMERVGAVVSDTLLTAAGAIGFTGLRDKWQSLDADQVGSALVALAESGESNIVVDARELRRRSS